MLVGWLDFHRETLAIKAGRVSTLAVLPRAQFAGSATSLLGLVRHLTEIERTYFRKVFAGEDVPALPFGTDPFGEEPGSDFACAAVAQPEEALAVWREEVERPGV